MDARLLCWAVEEKEVICLSERYEISFFQGQACLCSIIAGFEDFVGIFGKFGQQMVVLRPPNMLSD